MNNAIIFDMDGLMINSEEITFLGYQKVMGNRGLTIDLDFYTTLLGKPIIDIYEVFYKKYGNDIPIKKIINEVHDFVQNYFDINGVPLKAGLIDLLKYLKNHNYKTIIATSSTRERVEKILGNDGANILKYFNDSICGDEVEKGKPNPEIFLKACNKLKVKPDNAIVLEDSQTGILAAYNAKIRCICIPDMKYPDQEYINKTYKLFNCLLDVLEYLKN